MAQTAVEYAFKTEAGGWRVVGSRVSLDSVVYAYLNGETPEAIAEDFPTLTLERIYGAIAFYLSNKEEIDAYLKDQQALWETLSAQSKAANRELIERVKSRARRNDS